MRSPWDCYILLNGLETISQDIFIVLSGIFTQGLGSSFLQMMEVHLRMNLCRAGRGRAGQCNNRT